jgi:hypothetical protein
VLEQALKLWPNDPTLEQEKSAMTLSQEVMSAPSQFN